MGNFTFVVHVASSTQTTTFRNEERIALRSLALKSTPSIPYHSPFEKSQSDSHVMILRRPYLSGGCGRFAEIFTFLGWVNYVALLFLSLGFRILGFLLHPPQLGAVKIPAQYYNVSFVSSSCFIKSGNLVCHLRVCFSFKIQY